MIILAAWVNKMGDFTLYLEL